MLRVQINPYGARSICRVIYIAQTPCHGLFAMLGSLPYADFLWCGVIFCVCAGHVSIMPIHLPSKTRKYSWERIYKAAALEADNARVERRISVAEGTLMARLLELTDRQEDRVEGKALEKALRTLLTIKQKRLGHS